MNGKHIIISTLLFSASLVQSQDFQCADLPDAMTFIDGKVVKSMEDWPARKTEIQKLWCEYFIGSFPEEVPELLSAKVVRSTKYKDGSTRKRVILTFDTPNKKSFEMAVWEPLRYSMALVPSYTPVIYTHSPSVTELASEGSVPDPVGS